MEAKKKILLVEDEPDFRLAVRIRLQANGYDVIEAEDGIAGLDMARNQAPDLVILDVMLPKMEGYKVARLLKFDEKHRKMPIIMLTARSQQADKDTGLAVGSDAYLTKPFQPEELLSVIAKLLEK
jgi:DNA-binding response OmpR family regulator